MSLRVFCGEIFGSSFALLRVLSGLLFFLLIAIPALFAQQTFRIAGTVVDARSNTPLASAEVLLSPNANRQQTSHVTTGLDGRFSFAHLAAGKYTLSGSHRGYSMQGFDQHEFFATATAVGPGQDTEHLVFRLRPDATITGHITDDFGEPVRDARIRVLHADVREGIDAPAFAGETYSNDLGVYTFPDLSAGRYLLVVAADPWYAQHAPYRPQSAVIIRSNGPPGPPPLTATKINPDLDVTYPLTFYPGSFDPSAAEPITLRAGDTFSADLQLHALRTLKVTLHAPAGVRLQGAMVYEVLPNGEPWPGQRTTSFPQPSGDLIISGLAPGTYLIDVDFPLPAVDKPDPNPNLPRIPRRWRKRVILNGDADLDTSIPDTVAVTGTVAMDQPPSPKVAFWFNSEENGIAQTAQYDFTNNKPFSIELPQGDYSVGMADAAGYVVSNVTGKGAQWNGHRLHLDGGSAAELRVFVTNGVGTIDGFAVGETCTSQACLATRANTTSDQNAGVSPSAPPDGVAGVMVLLVPKDKDLQDDADLIRRDQSDSDGSFTLANVMPGSYSLLALRDGWNLKWRDPAVLKPFLAKAIPVTISGNTKLNLKVPVQ